MNQSKLRLAGVVAAAGLSSRMGDFKPLLPYAASTMIQTTIASLKNGGAQQIIVVVGHRGNEIKKQLDGTSGITVIDNPNYQHGDMLESVQLGLRQLQGYDAAYVLPGDMPAIAIDTFKKVQTCMKTTNASVVFPTLQGRKKHPPLIATCCFESICHFTGDGGLRTALQQFGRQTAYVAVDDMGCSMDVDTPEEYLQLLQYRDQK